MRPSSLVSTLVLCFTLLLAVVEAQTTCAEGYMVENGRCRKCDGGTYSPGGRSTECRPCDANFYSDNGAGSCTPCPAGQYSQQRSRQCQRCDPGTFSESGKSCKACDPGTISDRGAASCTPCGLGTYANGARTYCQECSAGSFQDQEGQTECKKCPRGYWQERQKKSYCDICPCGTFNEREGATKCDTCGNQYPVSDAGSTSRSQCFITPAGSYTNPSGCAVQCPAGSFQAQPGRSNCESCQGNSAAGPGSTQCTNCRMGTAPDPSKATCTPTSTGKLAAGKRALQTQQAMMCPPGHKACPVKSGQRNWFECIDVSSDLLSCGGCRGQGDGEDCTAFDPIASAQCVRGQCQFECPKGYTLTLIGCEKASRTRVF